MKTILIVGSAGQLGTEVRESAPAGFRIISADQHQLDISDAQKVSALVAQTQPDWMINCAAYTAVDKAEQEELRAFQVNRDGPANLARAAQQVAARLIHISTDFVFDGRASVPYTEEDAPGPVSVYGKSKLAGEEQVLQLIPDKSVIIRTSWLYSHRGHNFLKTMLNLMTSREELSVVDDQVGCPTSTASLTDVIWLAIEKNLEPGLYHWSDKGQASWYDFAKAIQEEAAVLGLLDRQIPIKAIPTSGYPTPAQRPAYSVMSREKIVQALGYAGRPWQEEMIDVLKRLKKAGSE